MNLPLTLRFARPALLGIALCAALLGCAGTTPADYASATPVLDLRQYFNGPLVAHGLVTDRSGKVMQRFRVDLVGTWVGDTGTLDERVMINRAVMRKFGFTLGEVLLSFQRPAP